MSITFFAVWLVATAAVFFGMGMHKQKSNEEDPFEDAAPPFSPKRLIASVILAGGLGFLIAALLIYGLEQTLAVK